MFKLSPCLTALLLSLGANAATNLAPACVTKQGKVDEKGFVAIGGIEQWITVTGDSCANPVILVIHGGPGNPLSPFADQLFGP
ncbi:hypothetical protein [Massilia sp. TWR1-2-2]|uniref:hypothetical protein n=1 Tax=Massilia sp. TWR1-2-2 TaxID=2804584 RepID=UPI003CEE86DF